MKTFLVFLMILVSVNAFPQAISPLNLRMTGELFYARTPGEQKGVTLTVKQKLPDVLLLASDGRNFNRPGINGQFQNEKGRQAFLVAIPKLYHVKDSANIKTFLFGRNSAENNDDLAAVKIIRQNGVATSYIPQARQPVIIGIAESEIFNTRTAGSSGNELGEKLVLQAEATQDETVTIEIDREENRGNVVVGIFSQRTGNLIAILNPKDSDNPSSRIAFTVAETVLIVPVIRPRVSSVNEVDSIVYEVGDPREVATVEATEE